MNIRKFSTHPIFLPSSHPPVFIMIFLFVFTLTSYSQDRCPYNGPQLPGNRFSTTVDNFTITDTEGNTYDLYQTLDSGMTVFIDLFFTRCSYCQQYAPIIEQIYQNTGAGEESILMWGISNDPYDTNPIIDQYKSSYNITNPCAGPQGGGTTAHTTIISGQNFLGWPTYCVICPDHTMFFDPVYPPTVSGFDPYFEECAEQTVGLEEDLNAWQQNILGIYPNPVKDILNIDVILNKSSSTTFELYDLAGLRISVNEYRLNKGSHGIRIDLSEIPSGYYFLKYSQNGMYMQTRRVIVL